MTAFAFFCERPLLYEPGSTIFPVVCKVFLQNYIQIWTTIAKLRTKKSGGIAIADLQNLTSAIPQLSAVSCQFRYFLVPFPQLRMVLIINQKYF
jgi:hypothetical protein